MGSTSLAHDVQEPRMSVLRAPSVPNMLPLFRQDMIFQQALLHLIETGRCVHYIPPS